MVYLSVKKISGKKYVYLVKSIRLADGKTTKIQKLVNEKTKDANTLAQKYSGFFAEKEKEAHAKFALKNYNQDSIFTQEQITKIEGMKIDYERLLKIFTTEQHRDAHDRFPAIYLFLPLDFKECYKS